MPVIQYRYKLSCINISNIGIYQKSSMIRISMFWPWHCLVCVLCYDWCCGCMPALQFCNCLVSIKHDGFGKRLCPSAKINYTVSCNIPLYHDTKEVIYRYTQNVYCYVMLRKDFNLLKNRLIWYMYIWRKVFTTLVLVLMWSRLKNYHIYCGNSLLHYRDAHIYYVTSVLYYHMNLTISWLWI